MLDLSVRFEGRTPLVVHNVRLASPLDHYAKAIKEITSKRKKTEEDYLELMRLEWEGGLYIDEEYGPYLPTSYPVASMKAAAAMTKLKTHLSRALISVSAEDGGDRIAIEYDGPRDFDGLWELDVHRDVRMVRVNSARTLRTRPRFPEWELNFRVVLDPKALDFGEFEQICKRAGRNIGIGEAAEGARARYDTTVNVLEAVEA